MNLPLKSPLFNFILGSVLGLAIGMGVVMELSKPVIAHAQEALADTAKTIEDQAKTIESQKQTLELRETAIANLIASLQNERSRANAAEANPAAQLLAQTGHVMTEAQCKAWMGVFPAVSPSQGTLSTVLYEAGGTQVNLSLFPGTPKIELGPHSEMSPRWVIPGAVAPQIVGGTRKAMYYVYDGSQSTWRGPFAPGRVTP